MTSLEQFMDKVAPDPASGCWLWLGAIRTKGYGAVFINHKNRAAHRVAYELLRGPIPAGKQVDHLCRVRSRVNPEHMEIVDNRTNVLRGIGVTATNARKSHCKRGHALDEANTAIGADGSRRCRICLRARNRGWWSRNRPVIRRMKGFQNVK